jgi:hypothetical protein
MLRSTRVGKALAADHEAQQSSTRQSGGHYVNKPVGIDTDPANELQQTKVSKPVGAAYPRVSLTPELGSIAEIDEAKAVERVPVSTLYYASSLELPERPKSAPSDF